MTEWGRLAHENPKSQTVRSKLTVNYFRIRSAYYSLSAIGCEGWGMRTKVFPSRAFHWPVNRSSYPQSASVWPFLSCGMDTQILGELARYLEPEVPDASEKINRFLSDETFYDMCSEYEECAKCLRHWARCPAKYARRIEEYSELIRDLEQEILRFFQEHQP